MDSMATYALTEFGFLRVSMSAFGVGLADAQNDLADIKKKIGQFVENAPSPRRPDWSTNAANVTDAHLIQVAQSAALQLATFNTGIPGAVLIN